MHVRAVAARRCDVWGPISNVSAATAKRSALTSSLLSAHPLGGARPGAAGSRPRSRPSWAWPHTTPVSAPGWPQLLETLGTGCRVTRSWGELRCWGPTRRIQREHFNKTPGLDSLPQKRSRCRAGWGYTRGAEKRPSRRCLGRNLPVKSLLQGCSLSKYPKPRPNL